MIYKDFKGLKLSSLGLGTMRLPNKGINGDIPIDEEETEKMVEYAIKKGITYGSKYLITIYTANVTPTPVSIFFVSTIPSHLLCPLPCAVLHNLLISVVSLLSKFLHGCFFDTFSMVFLKLLILAENITRTYFFLTFLALQIFKNRKDLIFRTNRKVHGFLGPWMKKRKRHCTKRQL